MSHQTHHLTPTSARYQAQRSASLKFWLWTGAAVLAVVDLGFYALRSFGA